MCSPAAPQGSAEYFHPDVKCCSFEPSLPNFIVGRILRDDDAAGEPGRRSVRERIDRRAGVGPWGLAMPRKYARLYGGGADLFGRSPELRCSHYGLADGRCTIWPYRNGVCATWYCKHERGEVGAAYWRALRDLLTEIEWSLGTWCAYELRAPLDQLAALASRDAGAMTPADLGGPRDARSVDTWGEWAGREAEFYARAAALVDGVTWPDIERIGGVRLAVRTAILRQAQEKLVATGIPARLTLGTFRITGSADGMYVIEAARERLRMPDALLRALMHVDGRATSAITDEIQADEGVRLSQGLLQKLLDFGLIRSSD